MNVFPTWFVLVILASSVQIDTMPKNLPIKFFGQFCIPSIAGGWGGCASRAVDYVIGMSVLPVRAPPPNPLAPGPRDVKPLAPSAKPITPEQRSQGQLGPDPLAN